MSVQWQKTAAATEFQQGAPEFVPVAVADARTLVSIGERLKRSLAKEGSATIAPRYPRSPLERDAEVANYLEQRFGVVPLAEIVEECRRLFGPARAPSRSSPHRYWQRLNGLRTLRKRRSRAIGKR